MSRINRRQFVSTVGAASAGLFLAGRIGAPAEAAARPNFVIIMGEAQGWTSTSVQMDDLDKRSRNPLFHTPNLERIAKEGMRFANGYAASPRCTPSRASLFTGKTPALLKMTFVNESGGLRNDGDSGNNKLLSPRPSNELPVSEVTIAEMLRKEGYSCAHFGKWHVGRTDPTRHGFDDSDGPNKNGGPENVQNPNPKQAFEITAKGVAFIEKQVKAGRPFYLQLSHYGGRRAEDARPETYAAAIKRAGGRNQRDAGSAAVAEDVDSTLGTVLKRLDELGIVDKTYVIFTADHGAPGRGANEPLRGGKGAVWEGGIRVPIIFRGPGIKPDLCSHTRITAFDLLPTIAELAGVRDPLPGDIEGGSLAPLLLGNGKGAVKRRREELVFHYPHYDNDNDGPATAIILGDMVAVKTYETGKTELFDLGKDVEERNDLSAKFPEKAAEMERLMSAYLKAIDAQMPTNNPDYDPSKKPVDDRRERRGEGDRRKPPKNEED